MSNERPPTISDQPMPRCEGCGGILIVMETRAKRGTCASCGFPAKQFGGASTPNDDNELQKVIQGIYLAGLAGYPISSAQAKVEVDKALEVIHQRDKARDKQAEERGVAWAIGAIDDLHINHTDTMQMSGEADRIYKGIKNTLRDRYKHISGVDPAPSYPVNAKLTNPEKSNG